MVGTPSYGAPLTSTDVVPVGFEPLFRTSPFLEMLGPLYCRRDTGRLVIGLRITAKHANARGLAHGGVLLTLCDIALGYSAAYSQDPPLSLTTGWRARPTSSGSVAGSRSSTCT